ncbi:MAG: hypoxanthine phosphoribosyltransferase [Mucilaginibacter sp.]
MKKQVADLHFELLISNTEIMERVREIAGQINSDYQNRTPVLVGILNGSFLFMADLVKELDIDCEVTFVKLASYHGGTASTRTIRDDFDLNIDIKNRHLVLIEDIVDTGRTMDYLVNKLNTCGPASISICSLLLKPTALECKLDGLKYVGFEIKNEFVVGYGLDYKELGRNLKEIYRKVD